MDQMHLLSNMKAKIEKMASEVQENQKDLGITVDGLNSLSSQLTENKLVKEELDHLEEGAKVYKLVGPVLIPQDVDEARSTVNTRIEYITKEVSTAKARVEKVEKEQQKRRVALLTEQEKFQALVQQVTAAEQ